MAMSAPSENCVSGAAGCCCTVDFPFSSANGSPEGKKEIVVAGSNFFARARPFLFGVGALLFAAGLLLPLQGPAELLVFAAAYLLWGNGVLLTAGRNIIRGSVFDENFLMSIATLGAFAIGEYPEGVAVMIFYQVGELLQGRAVERSRRSIRELMDIRPDYAHLRGTEGTTKVSPHLVRAGDIIEVRPGERVPLDGSVLEGSTTLDVSALTGESLPRDISPGDQVLSGSINQGGLISIKVSREYKESTVSRILSLVESAASRKAQTERFITRFARYYTPVVVAAAVLLALLPPLLLADQTFATWSYRALVFLVISCPCALVISIPLGFWGGIGGASRKGILVKGGNYLEALSNTGTVIFDKTGTLTQGSFRVHEILPTPGFTKRELLRCAASASRYSSHPVAVSVLRAWEEKEGRPGNGTTAAKTDAEKEDYKVLSFTEISGRGVKLLTPKGEVLMGNSRLLEQYGIPVQEEISGNRVYLAIGGKYAGSIKVEDVLREDTSTAVQALRNLGVRNIVMLTGDRKAVADRIGQKIGLDRVYSELLPHQKVEILERLQGEQKGKKKVAFVGDGINDAPALARADIGVAMGGIGSDAAVEAADVVLMTGEPSKLAEAISIARKTRGIVVQNVVLALGIKALVLFLGAAGLASLWEAVFADVGVALLAVLNAMRAMR